jgi:hypothetical protein
MMTSSCAVSSPLITMDDPTFAIRSMLALPAN